MGIMIFNKAIIYEKMANITNAIETYKDLIHRNPLFIDSYLRLANIYGNMGNFRKAIEYCDSSQEFLDKS